jgi:hypothetical protein
MGKRKDPGKTILEKMELDGLSREDFLSVDDLLKILPISRPTLGELDGLPITRIGKRNFVLKPLLWEWLCKQTEILDIPDDVEIPRVQEIEKDWISKRIDLWHKRLSRN